MPLEISKYAKHCIPLNKEVRNIYNFKKNTLRCCMNKLPGELCRFNESEKLHYSITLGCGWPSILKLNSGKISFFWLNYDKKNVVSHHNINRFWRQKVFSYIILYYIILTVLIKTINVIVNSFTLNRKCLCNNSRRGTILLNDSSKNDWIFVIKSVRDIHPSTIFISFWTVTRMLSVLSSSSFLSLSCYLK